MLRYSSRAILCGQHTYKYTALFVATDGSILNTLLFHLTIYFGDHFSSSHIVLSFITIAGMHISNGYRHWQQLLKRLQSCIWEILKVRACVGILYAERIQLEMPVLHRTSLAPSSWQTQACGPGRGSLINQPTEGRVCTGQGLHLQAWHLTTVNFNFYFLWWGS